MAINLNNVNISLDEFQKISSGWFNAGEVRLKDEHTLAKVNHHVETWFFSNKEKVDHKLEYRKFEVSYDFHIDKLYKFEPGLGAPTKEITL